jgi:hypothetical protein
MPALLTQQKADLPTEVEKSACFCARPAYGECARCNGPGRCNSPDSRHGAIMLPVRILPSHRSQFCNGGVSSLRRMPLQIRSCAHSAGRAGFVPISFAPLPDPQKGLRQAATPDQQAIFIFHFIIGIQGNKVNPRSGLFPRETTIAYRFRQKRLLRHLTKQPLSTVSCRLLSLIL